ncbi:MAG: PD-(D/E)XK nuclease family protein, partial [Cyanobacteria bacterium P01_C01_bin.72]
GVASGLLSRRLLQNAVREVIHTQDIAGTAQAFLATIKDLFRSGSDLVKLQENIEPRVQQLGRLALAYQNQLRRVKRLDAAELYWQSAADCERQTYIFYGYFAPSRDELALIEAIAGENSVLLLPTRDFYPQNHQALIWLQSQGWELRSTPGSDTASLGVQLQQCWQQTAPLPAGVKLNLFPSLEAEIRGVLTQVKVLQTQGVAAQDIVLVTREEQLYGEILRDIAWEYDVSVQVSYEIPVEQTRLGAWLKLLLEVIRDSFPFEATAKLLSHPLVKQMPPEIWTKARASHPQGLTAWQDLGIDLSLLDFQQRHSREFWVNRLLDILSAWEILENAKTWAREVVAYYRLQSGLKELAQSKEQQLSKRVFSQEISEILSLMTIPAQPGRGGVELHCLTSISGTNYAHVFLLGCAEGILPTAIADDPLLDFQSRKQLLKQGFPLTTAVDLAAKETFDFYSLLGVPTHSITFSYPELRERNPCLPSPYLSRLGLKPAATGQLPLASVEQVRQLYLRQPSLLDSSLIGDRHREKHARKRETLLIPEITHALQVESNRERAIAPDQYDGVISIGIAPQQIVFSAS